jgi:hypothetical protein
MVTRCFFFFLLSSYFPFFFLDIPHNFAGMPSILVLILVETGLPGIALTLTVGQLVSDFLSR